MQHLEYLLSCNIITEVFFGSQGFSIVDHKRLNEIQLGYSRHPDGTELSGEESGDWLKEWIVIGTDTEIGDPFFVDSSDPELPVFTAMHGCGEWESETVSVSLPAFLKSLDYLQSLSKQKYAILEPNEETITDPNELEKIEKRLAELSGNDDFWEAFFEQYNEWLGESDS